MVHPDRGARLGLHTLLALAMGFGAGAFFAATPTSAQAPGQASTQHRPVVYNEVNVSSQGAGITLEFEDGQRLSVELRGGELRIDGSEAGRYTPGDALDQAWRALLGQAIAVDNGGVARLLADWSMPQGLSGDAEDAGRALTDRLRGALSAPVGAMTGPAGAADGVMHTLDAAAQQSILQWIVRSPERAGQVALLLEGRDPGALDLRIGERVEIDEGEVVEGALLLIDGDLYLDGEVDGDVLVLGGSIRLGDEARIGGDLRWLDGVLRGNRDAVSGSLVELALSDAAVAPSVTDIRAEVERGIRDGIRDAAGPTRSSRSSPGFFRNLVSGVGGLLQTAVTFALFLGIGIGILYFFPRHFEVIARTASNVPGRAFAVGWAGVLLAPLAWIAGIVLLAATIIGIPVLLLWLPLFWVAFASAALVGFLVVCRNVGTWWVHRGQGYQPQGIDSDQPAARLGIGLALFLAIFAAASVLEIGGSLFKVFQVVFVAAGSIMAVNAAVLGLGAVLLSRAGRDRRWARSLGGLGGLDDMDLGDDPFEPGPGPRGGSGGRGPRPGARTGPRPGPRTGPRPAPGHGPSAEPGADPGEPGPTEPEGSSG